MKDMKDIKVTIFLHNMKTDEIVDVSTLPEEEKRKIFHEMNVKTLTEHGYVPQGTEETA